MSLDELDGLEEDDETERIMHEYKMKRMAEMKEVASKSRFGEVINITGALLLVKMLLFCSEGVQAQGERGGKGHLGRPFLV